MARGVLGVRQQREEGDMYADVWERGCMDEL